MPWAAAEPSVRLFMAEVALRLALTEEVWDRHLPVDQ
jgi:hypothetical protein